MTYSLPFGLKQKPVNHYFIGGLIKFNIREGTLHYTVKQITKTVNAEILKGQVKSKVHLDQLLSIKAIWNIEQQTIEEVVS